MGSPGNDNFVSISLDGRECDICLQDTGQELTTCDVCARFLTDGPVQEGFNELPELIHTDTLAHLSCFRKFHKLARRLSRSSAKHQDKCQTGHTVTQSTQWLNFNSNNLGNELLLENIRNRVSKSNPGSRSGSPLFAGGSRIGKLKDAERCRSEPRLEASSAHELQRGYTKYLFGKHERDGGQNMKVPEQQRHPVDPIGDRSCVPSREVPTRESINTDNKTKTGSFQPTCKLESSPQKSCQSKHYQYLTKMHTLSIKDKERQVLDRKCQVAKTGNHNDAKYSRTLTGCHENKCATETNIACCHGNQELKMKDVPPRDDNDEELWRNVKHLSKESLPVMPLPELRSHIEKLQCAVNDACSQLVHHLQEKDVLRSEVASRHVTIKKLVERQTNLHH